MYVVRHLETPLTVFVFKKKKLYVQSLSFFYCWKTAQYFSKIKTSMKYTANGLALNLFPFGTERNPTVSDVLLCAWMAKSYPSSEQDVASCVFIMPKSWPSQEIWPSVGSKSFTEEKHDQNPTLVFRHSNIWSLTPIESNWATVVAKR